MYAQITAAAQGVFPAEEPRGLPPTKDTALHDHIRADANALGTLEHILRRLHTLHGRLVGFEGEDANAGEPKEPTPEAIVPRLQQLAGKMERALDDLAKIVMQLEAIG